MTTNSIECEKMSAEGEGREKSEVMCGLCTLFIHNRHKQMLVNLINTLAHYGLQFLWYSYAVRSTSTISFFFFQPFCVRIHLYEMNSIQWPDTHLSEFQIKKCHSIHATGIVIFCYSKKKKNNFIVFNSICSARWP